MGGIKQSTRARGDKGIVSVKEEMFEFVFFLANECYIY